MFSTHVVAIEVVIASVCAQQLHLTLWPATRPVQLSLGDPMEIAVREINT